jgi:hypothetical protein
MEFEFNALEVAGTTETFRLGLAQFDHKDQRWTVECQIGEEQVILGSRAGIDDNLWYVIGHPKVELPEELRFLLAAMSHQALADFYEHRDYCKAVGEYPKELLQ